MINHEVRTYKSSEKLAHEDQLAYKMAEVAVDPVPVDADVQDMVINRVIDNAAVAAASVHRKAPTSAREQAMPHKLAPGANIFGLATDYRVSPEWAAWANGVAVRELDFHDTFLAKDYSHPGDNIPAVLAVAQHKGIGGKDLINGIATAYEIQVNLVKGICLHEHKIDHVVDFVFVQADALDQVDLDFVCGRDAVDEVLAADSLVLGDCEDSRDVVAGVRVVLREEGVVEVEFADCNTVCPRRPFGRHAVVGGQTEDVGTGGQLMRHGLFACRGRRLAVDRCGGNGGVVDDAVDDHVLDIGVDRNRVDGDFGHLVGELVFVRQLFRALVRAHFVVDHGFSSGSTMVAKVRGDAHPESILMSR